MKRYFDPAIALDKRASKAERTQAKIDRIGHGLAEYAIKQANEGKIGVEIKARTRRFLGHTAFIHRTPEIYQSANEVLAEEGLVITKTAEAWHPVQDIFTPADFDFMTIRLSDVTLAIDTTPAPVEDLG